MEPKLHQKKKTIKIKSFEKKLHLGFLEFLLGAAGSADPATTALDDAVLELIIDEKINKIKKDSAFFSYSVSLKSKKQNKPTNPQSEYDSKSKPWNFRERERESKRVLANLVIVVCCCCCCFELGICCFVL